MEKVLTKTLSLSGPITRNELNSLGSRSLLETTSLLRYKSAQFGSFVDIYTMLVPFPQIHYIGHSMSPLNGWASQRTQCTKEEESALAYLELLKQENSLCRFDKKNGKYLSAFIKDNQAEATNYIKERNTRTHKLLSKRGVDYSFVDFVAYGFRFGETGQRKIPKGPKDLMEIRDDSLLLLYANTEVSKLFEQLRRDFTKMFDKRAFLPHFFCDGLDEMDFRDSLETLEMVIQLYCECLEVVEEEPN